MSGKEFVIRKPDDFHVHLRRDSILDMVLPYTAEQFGRALVMPNTEPKILTAKDAQTYYWEIETRRRRIKTEPNFRPLMSIYLTEKTTANMIFSAALRGVYAAKLYPKGATTNSQDGVADIEAIFPVLAEMEKMLMVLSIHAEEPTSFCMDREAAYLGNVQKIHSAFPKLKIVWEHVATAAMVAALEQFSDNVAATITAHHLVLTLDDIVGKKIKPHNFCKPLPGRPEDREALIGAATSGNPRFFFGSDSAPHSRLSKEIGQGAAGILSAPVAMPILAQVFEERGASDKLNNFTSVFGARFYKLSLNEERLTLEKEKWQVPYSCPAFVGHGIVPFMAGEVLSWRIKK